MSRRVSMPAADDLFRPTAASLQAVPNVGSAAPAPAPEPAPQGRKTSSGRVRHDEKMTVYITSDELMDIEHARLVLRREHGIAADRGRVVREAVALVLAEFEAHGEDSALVRRLTR
ncbi:hypothetical protein [Nocardioides jiangxiensis]|uniref:Centromere-binding protein ParB C-terminal domain-containing protein n=1 Tax=Nocardioides jiangxiensis TaxID=3064524 RepID=A0ABT9AWH0_9ACTN|nr:hypothetical protein [Nocardioides sp. WY-20]MDO7866757.1 hypothetical protein [Nocardioides sp. WY-20]